MAVVVEQHHALKPPVRSERCRLQSHTHLDHFILEPNKQIVLAHSLERTVGIPTFQRSFSTPCLTLNIEEPDTNPRIEIISGKGAHGVRVLVVEVAIALASGILPILVTTGLGGAYFLCGRNGDYIAVAKPVDEEPLACNNPKGFTGRIGQPGLKRSVKAGESGMRELAAYLLDHGGFAHVPPTALVKISHVPFHVGSSESATLSHFKIASLQRFMDHDCDAGDLGPSSFSVSCVHRIGILDVRLLNIDRHSGNILVRKRGDDNHPIGESELIPIDHGLCLPDWLDDPYFEWLHWPQASIPFSEPELEYISNLNPFEDAKLLRTELPCLSKSSIRVLVICTIFLKRAAAAGFCLGDIGQMMTREYCGVEESMSVLEKISVSAKDSIGRPPPLSNALDDFLDELEAKMKEYEQKEEEEDSGVFEFDEEKPALDEHKMSPSGKPPKIPGFLCERSSSGFLSPLIEEEGQNITIENKKNWTQQSFIHRAVNVSNIWRSASFSVHNHNNNEAGGISFEDLDEGDWERFLEAFDKLLPEVFEERMGIASTQRLGTSCEF